MARWEEFAAADPELAALGEKRFAAYELVMIGTIRADGSARVSPIEYGIRDGDLWLGMMPGSMKARDVLRDPRITVHNVVANKDGKDGEFKIVGAAVLVTGERREDMRRHILETTGIRCRRRLTDVHDRYPAGVGHPL